MSSTETRIQDHYGQSDLYDKIVSKLAESGITESDLKPEHLKPVDEFHIGGAAATEALLDPLGFGAKTRVLDIGSGIGGAARFMNARYGAQVTGIDLTPEYVDCAQRLTHAVGLEAEFEQGSALDIPLEDHGFDAATLIHVGMNLPDKDRLFSEVARVLKPKGVFAVYDVMLFGRHPDFPLPWATQESASFLTAPEVYESAAQKAGFTQTHRREKGDIAKAFFAQMRAAMAKSGPAALGLPLLMGDAAAEKVANMVRAVDAGDIQPVEMIFRKGA